jgi:hypothetical protein
MMLYTDLGQLQIYAIKATAQHDYLDLQEYRFLTRPAMTVPFMIVIFDHVSKGMVEMYVYLIFA